MELDLINKIYASSFNFSVLEIVVLVYSIIGIMFFLSKAKDCYYNVFVALFASLSLGNFYFIGENPLENVKGLKYPITFIIMLFIAFWLSIYPAIIWPISLFFKLSRKIVNFIES